jgi:hypothetical protein
MLKIKNYKYINNAIEIYFNTYLFDIRSIDINEKKLFIVKNNDNNIIGSFFINKKYDILENLYIVEQERGKGNCSKIINYLKKDYLSKKHPYIFFDVDKDNVNAVKCYEKKMKYIGVTSHKIIHQIYNFVPNKNKIFLRYCLLYDHLSQITHKN